MSHKVINNIDVLIMCGGKSGSSTLYVTLKKNYKCLKIHSYLDYIEQFNSNKLYESIDESSNNRILYIIDSYRTPIERKISSFFENITIHVPNYKSLSIVKLINLFNEKFLYTLEEYHSINEVFRKYDIPLFDTFDFNKHYNITYKGTKIFIKLLYKDIDNWGTILSRIFKKKIIIRNDNISDTKDYFTMYTEFKKKYKIPKKYIDNLLKNDREFTIYNTKDEQEKYIKKWSAKSY
jgi:hypothetical protein